MTENPYAPPTTLPADGTPKPKWKQAKLAWILPLAGMVLAIVVGNLRVNTGGVETLACWACLIGGFVYTVLGFVHARKYSNALPNAIGGCVTLLVVVALCIIAFTALAFVMTQGRS